MMDLSQSHDIVVKTPLQISGAEGGKNLSSTKLKGKHFRVKTPSISEKRLEGGLYSDIL